MTSSLREGVQRLEMTMRVTLGVLAIASGVYTYLGVRELLNGNATMVLFAAVIYSLAVTIGIYAFWSFLLGLLPHIREATGRGLLFGCMALGAAMIIAMSAWLNASALAGAAAVQQHMATTLEAYTRDLGRAHNNALAAQRLLPDIEMASTRFSKLADEERSGSLTGTAGSGTVVQLLNQMSGQLGGLARQVTESADRVKALFEQGGKHLATMRELVSGRGPVTQRSDAFAAEAIALGGVIASLQQTSVAPAVKRAADGLASGFIAPVAGGRGDLGDRQTAVVGKVQGAVAAQAASLSGAAERITALPHVEPARFQPLSPAEAVVRYAADFIPSWAGAISIDLLPGVLVLILCVVHASIRREALQPASAASMSAAELIMALRLVREVGDAQTAAGVPHAAGIVAEPDTAAPQRPTLHAEAERFVAPEAEENVRPLTSARGKKE